MSSQKLKVFKRTHERMKTLEISKNTDPNLSKSSSGQESSNKGSCGTVSPLRIDSSFEQEIELKKGKESSDLIEKLNEKLQVVEKNDFKGMLNVYFCIFDLVVIRDSIFSQVLTIIKDGIVQSLKGYYKEKRKGDKLYISKLNSLVNSLKKDKENLIVKLNKLSSQNIDLINSYQDLQQKFQKFQTDVSQEFNTNKSLAKILQEVNEKNEKIRELCLKINEMNTHENKLLSIIEKINVDGHNIEEIYEKSPSIECPSKKKKKLSKVPSINLNLLHD